MAKSKIDSARASAAKARRESAELEKQLRKAKSEATMNRKNFEKALARFKRGEHGGGRSSGGGGSGSIITDGKAAFHDTLELLLPLGTYGICTVAVRKVFEMTGVRAAIDKGGFTYDLIEKGASLIAAYYVTRLYSKRKAAKLLSFIVQSLGAGVVMAAFDYLLGALGAGTGGSQAPAQQAPAQGGGMDPNAGYVSISVPGAQPAPQPAQPTWASDVNAGLGLLSGFMNLAGLGGGVSTGLTGNGRPKATGLMGSLAARSLM